MKQANSKRLCLKTFLLPIFIAFSLSENSLDLFTKTLISFEKINKADSLKAQKEIERTGFKIKQSKLIE